MTTETKSTVEFWAVIELFGHNTIAGFVTEQSIGGGAFIRIDVPAADEEHSAFTKFYGAAAIYGITPTSEEVALAAVKRLRVRPVSPYTVPVERQLVDSRATDDDDDEWEHDRFGRSSDA